MRRFLRVLPKNHEAYIFNSFWESGLEFAAQFILIGLIASAFVRPIQLLCQALQALEKGDLTLNVCHYTARRDRRAAAHFQ